MPIWRRLAKVVRNICVEEKTNEITTVPKLLDLIDVKGDIVTADAMSCQKKIVKKIIDKKADYTIGLKQNQPELYKDTEDYFRAFSADIPSKTTIEKGHGRIEKRAYQLLTNLSWLEQKDEWNGLNALGCVKSRLRKTEKSVNLRDILSLRLRILKHLRIL